MLIDLQRALERALRSDTPLDVLRREAAELSPEDRAAVGRISADGFRIASFLVRKLRFERICRADTSVEDWFEREPDRVAGLFREYNRDVPPREFFPHEEARAFRAYLESRGIRTPGSDVRSKD